MTGKIDAVTRGDFDENVRRQRAAWITLDEERVRNFLAGQPSVRSVTSFSLTRPEGQGISNGIAFVHAEIERDDGLETCELVVRYAPGTQLLRQKSFEEEFKTLQVVNAAGIPSPKALYLDSDGSGLGAAGYVMERVFGDTPSAGIFATGLLAEATPDQRHALMLEGIRFHGALCGEAIGADRAPHLLRRGTGSNSIERETNWWMAEATPNLEDDPDRLMRLQSAREWLLDNIPDVRPPSLVHGDSQFANLIYRDGKVIAGIDWELSYLGHGESDLALMILMPQMQGAGVEGIPDKAEAIAAFEEAAQTRTQAFDYFDAFLHYKLLSVLPASRLSMPGYETFWDTIWSRFLELKT